MTRPTFQGSIVALITPFRNGKVDEAKLRELVNFHAAQGTDAIVPCGTTGESPTLSHDEHKRVVEIVIDEARGRLPIIAGTGSNSTAEAIDLTAHAKKAGATAALVVNPYYNKPTQEGLYRHFRAVAEAVDIPIILYNIAGRTAVNVETDTLARLVRDCPSIVGVKEASGSLDQMTQVILACGPDFSVLSGDDNITLPLMSVGGRGVISVIANFVPRETVGDDACRARRRLEARARAPSEAVPAVAGHVHRDQSDPRQGDDGAHGHDRAGVPPADVPHVRRQSGSGSCAVLEPFGLIKR